MPKITKVSTSATLTTLTALMALTRRHEAPVCSAEVLASMSTPAGMLDVAGDSPLLALHTVDTVGTVWHLGKRTQPMGVVYYRLMAPR